MDDFFEKEAVIMARIEPGRSGKVELNGVDWDAVSDSSLTLMLRQDHRQESA